MPTYTWWKSKTILGAVLAAVALVYPDPKNIDNWIKAIGLILAAVGARGAIAKNGEGK